MALLNESTDLNVIVLKLHRDVIQVLIETVSQLNQRFINLGFDFLLQSVRERLVTLIVLPLLFNYGVLHVGDLALQLTLLKPSLALDLLDAIAPIRLRLAHLRMKFTDCIVDFLELFGMHVLVVHSPLVVVRPEFLILLLEALNAADQVLLHCADNFLKAVHLRLNYTIDVVDVLECGLL